MRYFRGAADAGDTDTRVLNLWNAVGVRLGSVTVTSTAGESGWQVGTLSAPITLQAGATYIVSYGTTQNYAYTENYFNTPHTGPDGVLTAGIASGVFANGTPGVFPTASFNASNYWADVTFVTGTAANTAPVITSAATLTSQENRLAVGTIVATDANGDVLAYAIIGGADAARFAIDASTGVLSFVSAPDYEAPADAGVDNTYDVTVSVSDGITPAVTQALAITVTDVAETPANAAPVFTSPATASAAENQLVATMLTATDANGDPLTYAIADGIDAARFAIDASTGALSFVSAPDFEAPADAGGNNTYDVTVSVSDGIAPAVTQVLAITVTDVADNNLPPTIAPIVAPNTDEDVTSPVQIDLLSGAADPEGNPIAVLPPVSVTSSNSARIVAFTVSVAGVLSFDAAQFGTLNAGQSELLTVSYRIGDGVNAGVLNTATITVEGRDEVIPGQIITGTSAVNTLTGGEGNDTINGLAGNDTIRGNGGNDTINGGANTDDIDAGAGNDLILIAGNAAVSDAMAGGLGIDTVKIIGADGAVLTSTSQMTSIETFDGSGLSLRGNASVNIFDFSAFTVTDLAAILAQGGNDTVVGSAGADVIDGGNGTDNIDGGLGNDAIRVTGTEAQTDTMAGGDGTDTLQIFGSVDLTLNGTFTIAGIEALDGGGRSIVGTNGANAIDLSIFDMVTNLTGVRGLGGNDTLAGGSLADGLDGGSGTDTVRGSAGDDTIVVRTNEALNDIIEGGAGAADRILVDGSSNLSLSNTGRITGIERLEGSGGAIVGSSGADTLDFSGIIVSGISSIQGGSGADTIAGGMDADVLTGGLGDDSFVFRIDVPSGTDRVTDFDVLDNDVIRLVGFSPSSNLAGATTFDSQGALIDLSDIGGSGTIRLTGVTSLSYTTEDFLFV